MDYNELCSINTVLADENRIRIIDMLSCYSMSANELLQKLKVTQPTLSFHLNKLVEANFVLYEKVGTKKFYQLNTDYLNSYLDSLNQLCSSKESCKCFEENDGKI